MKTREEIVAEVKERLGDEFIVSDAWVDSQDENDISYIVVRIDDCREEK